MQYLLTQEEMDATRQKVAAINVLPSVEKLQEFCTMVADSMPVKSGWYEGKAWGCILTVKREWYCDSCPAKEVCPYHGKRWSK